MKNLNFNIALSFLVLLMIASSCGSSYNDYYSENGFDEAFLAELSPEERAQFLQDFYEDEEYENYEETYPSNEEYQQSHKARNVSNVNSSTKNTMQNVNYNQRQTYKTGNSTKTVQLYDRGYGMVMATVTIPQNWNVDQYLETNRAAGSIQHFKLDYFNSKGELIRFMKPTTYSSYFGQSFQSSWNQLMQQYVTSAIQQVRFQQMQRSQKVLSTKMARDYAKIAQGGIDGFEQRFTGTMNGRAVEGIVYSLYWRGQVETIVPVAVISPAGQLNNTIAILDMIDRTAQENPQYKQAVGGDMSNRAVAHGQRMQQLNNRIRQRRGEIYAIHEQQSREFNQRIREEGLGYNGSRHTSNDRFTDAIRGQMTIENGYTGEQERVDQSYQYWYVNPSGQKYGTNNPNFNPQTLPGGNWQRANPVSNY